MWSARKWVFHDFSIRERNRNANLQHSPAVCSASFTTSSTRKPKSAVGQTLLSVQLRFSGSNFRSRGSASLKLGGDFRDGFEGAGQETALDGVVDVLRQRAAGLQDGLGAEARLSPRRSRCHNVGSPKRQHARLEMLNAKGVLPKSIFRRDELRESPASAISQRNPRLA